MSSFLCVALACLAQFGDEPRFRKTPQGLEVAVTLSGAAHKAIPAGKLTSERGEDWLRVCLVDEQAGKPGPPMLGAYERRGDELIFRPRFPLEAGRLYRAYFGKGAATFTEHRVAKPAAGQVPVVVKIYPTADVLPANVLRFTIHFSEPMRGGPEIFRQIEILDEDGKKVQDPWLLDEIWDDSDQVLIIYIHPGRIKWGVLLREELGPVFLPGKNYSLVLRGTLQAANDEKLGKDYVKKFRTLPEDRTRIELGQWKVKSPAAQSKEPLAIQFGKVLDHKAARFLTVEDAQGKLVFGTFTMAADGRSCSFRPAQAWQNQQYTLKVNGRLEDVAGNTPLRPFDMDLKSTPPTPQPLTFPFRPH